MFTVFLLEDAQKDFHSPALKMTMYKYFFTLVPFCVLSVGADIPPTASLLYIGSCMQVCQISA